MRILLAIDGSTSADRARDLVAALPLREGGRIRIVSVVPTRGELASVPLEVAGVPGAEDIEAAVLATHRDAIDAAEREIRSTRSDLVIEPILARGRPASVIVDEARDMGADLVVVGHRGHGAWGSMLLGSVSAEVVDHAPCPVLVARDERLGHVVLADDGSASARTAVGVLADWPLFTGLPVTILTVTEEGHPDTRAPAPIFNSWAAMGRVTSTETSERSTPDHGASATARLRGAGFVADAQTRTGDPAHEIIDVAQERGAGLIIVGTRGQTGLRRLILGSVARNVLLHAPCSVLVVREDALTARPTTRSARERELVSPFG